MKQKKNIVLAVLFFIVLLVIGGVALLLTQGVNRKAPVAPNAPSSRPHAGACTLTFEVAVPSCGSTCTDSTNCSNGMTCSGGVCRNPDCTTESTCVCPPATITCTQGLNDEFASSTIDTTKWTVEQGSVVAQNGQLVLSEAAGSSDSVSVLKTSSVVSGDFDTTVDFKSLAVSPQVDHGSQEFVVAALNGESVHIAFRKKAAGPILETNSKVGSTWAGEVDATADATAYTMRIQRVGSDIKTYYKSSGSSTYTLLGDFTSATTEPVRIELVSGSWDSHPTVTATFDNFTLECVTVATASPSPSPSPSPTVSPSPSPTSTPTPGCNSACATDNDCPSTMTCTSDSVCRNPNNPGSSTCEDLQTGGFFIRKYMDADGNGYQGTNEKGMTWKFQWQKDGDGNWQDYQTNESTSGEGSVITLPVSTKVEVKEVAVDGWTATTPTDVNLTIKKGENRLMVFGNWQGPAPTSTPYYAPPAPRCQSTCTSNSNCPSSMICSSGYCRNPSCTESPNCYCAQATPPPQPVTGASIPTYGILGIGAIITVIGLLGLLAM
ncbi:MAG TPA: hypothetical protein VLH19_03250 [Patescibacteria group bacterium]|nr:hypothetical protein [Patescibacteria group bacterium]